MAYFGMHNLTPLCGAAANHYPSVSERIKVPFLRQGLVHCTNGQALLMVAAALVPDVTAEPPEMGDVDALPWGAKECRVGLAELRAFSRRDAARDTKYGDRKPREMVSIHGVPLDAALLRRYLPSGSGDVWLSRCTKKAWFKKPAALRVRHADWTLIVMACGDRRMKMPPEFLEWRIETDRKGCAA